MLPDSNHQGCESGFPDVHMKWLFDGGHTLESSSDYPLQDAVGECRAEAGYGAEYFQYRVRRQVAYFHISHVYVLPFKVFVYCFLGFCSI